jgi:hypothetical protein
LDQPTQDPAQESKLELKKAYETLGLPEDSTREQVENRYFILMKRARSAQTRAGTESNGDSNSPNELTEVTRAYNLVLGIESEKTGTIEKQTKFAHFMYYYKFHLIASILVLLVAGFMIKDGIDKRNAAAKLPPSNLSVAVFGDFYNADVDLLQQNMLKLVPDWKRINTTLTYVPPEIKSQQDMAMQQKSVLTLITEKSELYILDGKNFASLATQGALVKLSDLQAAIPFQIPADKLRSAQAEGDTSAQPYGIDITDNPIFQGIETDGARLIVAVRADQAKWPDTIKLLEPLIRTTP